MIINTSNWKNFLISDIFLTEKKGNKLQVPTGSMISPRYLKEGTIPRITVSNVNNGITGYYSKIDNPNYRIYENFISVSFLGTVFYQKFSASLDMKVHCLKPIEFDLNDNIALFLVSVVRESMHKYIYADQLASTVLPYITIKLPTTLLGKPDWAFIEDFMEDLKDKAHKKLTQFQTIEGFKKKFLDINNWQEFTIDSLFEVIKGKRLTKANMKEGNIRFVGASAKNNGETCRISNKTHIHPANTITVCYNGSVGETFYQEEPFWASDDVNVLYPRFNLNKKIAMFLCPIIKTVGQKYVFIDKWKKEDMEKDKIKLPVDANGYPDFSYMENYIETVQDSIKNKMKIFSSI